MHPPAHETVEAWHDEPRVCTRRKFRGRGYIILGLAALAWIVVAVIAGFVFGIASLLIASGADAHSWYPMRCCWSPETAPAGRAGDCDAIPDSAVRAGPDGYQVTLLPGQHLMVTEPLSVTVPYPKAEFSQDGKYHICFAPAMTVRCFFAGPAGS